MEENKLTLEHLAKHLPYGLKFISEMDKPSDDFGIHPIWTLDGMNKMFGEYFLLAAENKSAYSIIKCKPILRPISDLTKEIQHKGEKFTPWDVLIDLYDGRVNIESEMKSIISDQRWINRCSNLLVLWLLQHNFDVDDLIGSKLAIDTNELKENPYK